METNICKNCNYQTNDDFCSKCGHPVKLKKIDKNFVFQEIKSVLFTDKGFFYTTKRILLSPGDSVRYYIEEDRSKYVKPVTYLIITALIYTIISHLFNVVLFEQINMNEYSMIFGKWMVEYRGYITIMMDFYIAFWIKVFFRKSGYNLFEIFTLMCYLSGIKSLLISLTSILQSLIHSNMFMITISISMIFSFWAIGQFFDKKKAKSYIKAILSYIVGVLSLGFLAGIISAVIFIIVHIVK